MPKTSWKIRRLGGTEFVCQFWCPRLQDQADEVWNYTASVHGPIGMRHNLARREQDRGHTAKTLLQECPTCITAVLDGPVEAPPGDCGPVFTAEHRDALHEALGAEHA